MAMVCQVPVLAHLRQYWPEKGKLRLRKVFMHLLFQFNRVFVVYNPPKRSNKKVTTRL